MSSESAIRHGATGEVSRIRQVRLIAHLGFQGGHGAGGERAESGDEDDTLVVRQVDDAAVLVGLTGRDGIQRASDFHIASEIEHVVLLLF